MPSEEACGSWFNDKTGPHGALQVAYAGMVLPAQSKVSVHELSEKLKWPYKTIY